MIRNLEEFKKGAFVIHCSQREEAKKLLETLRNAGISWATSETIGDEVLGYEDYGDEVCYMMDNGDLYYAELDYAQTWGKVVEYNDIFEQEYQLIDLLKNPGILYSMKGDAQGPLYKYDPTLDKVVCSWDGGGRFCNPIYSMLGLAKSVFIREDEKNDVEVTFDSIVKHKIKVCKVKVTYDQMNCQGDRDFLAEYHPTHMIFEKVVSECSGGDYLFDIINNAKWYIHRADHEQILKRGDK